MRKVNSVSSTTTDYVDGIQYTNGTIDFIQTEEGRALNSGGTYSYQYDLKDHLGNVRFSFKENPITHLLDTLQRDDYYAFGLRKVAVAGANNYLYNGKELQDELGQYDYGARFYDPVVGRWNVVDPLAEADRKTSPYAYVFNNPLRYIDPDGMAAYDWYQSNETGTVKWFDGDGEQEGYEHIGAKGTVTSTGSNAGVINLNADGTATNAATGESARSSTSGNTTIVPKDNTSDIVKLLLDIISGGSYSNQANALDVLDKDGLESYNHQMIADARKEIRGDWMFGAYQIGASTVANTEKSVLNGPVAENFERFMKKIPANSKASASYSNLADGNFLFQATSPGKVPGSSAVYQKWVNTMGETYKMLKTTYAPDGSIIHVKPKM